MDRRSFLRAGAGAVGAVTASAVAGAAPAWASEGFAKTGPSPYGDLSRRKPDRNGIVLPEGFRSRVIAVGGVKVAQTDYKWHPFSDGGATFPDGRGGWF